MPKTFRTWLMAYNRDTPIMDLADDVRRDKTIGDWETHEHLRSRLTERGVPSYVLDALKQARASYRRAVATPAPLA